MFSKMIDFINYFFGFVVVMSVIVYKIGFDPIYSDYIVLIIIVSAFLYMSAVVLLIRFIRFIQRSMIKEFKNEEEIRAKFGNKVEIIGKETIIFAKRENGCINELEKPSNEFYEKLKIIILDTGIRLKANVYIIGKHEITSGQAQDTGRRINREVVSKNGSVRKQKFAVMYRDFNANLEVLYYKIIK